MDLQVTATVPQHTQAPTAGPVALKAHDLATYTGGTILALILVILLAEGIRVIKGRKK